MTGDTESFEAWRPQLLALAYRMLGDMGRAEDAVQEAWLRWQGRKEELVESARAYLVKVVTRLCLNELDSARARREESRGDRLPEPVHLDEGGLGRVEAMDRVSMAFLVLLQRLTPAERAVLLLHDVFDLGHAEIGSLIRKSEVASRQLLRRARVSIAAERKLLVAAPPEEHRRLLQAFLKASSDGDSGQLLELLASDAVLVADTGPGGARYGRVRNLPGPLMGATKIAAFLAAVVPQGPEVVRRECELNGQPAIVTLRGGQVTAAVILSVAGGKIHRIFIHADPARLRYVCGLS